jgi:diguanylate cyclase (GGDEF)-like protein
MALAGHPNGVGELLAWSDVWWVPLTWAAYFVVNLGLLAVVLRAEGPTEWSIFRGELPWHVVSESVGFTLSPVVVALVDEGPVTPLLLALSLAVISETYSVTRRTEHESLHDPLTDLANRRRFLLAMEERVASGAPFVLLLVDLDRFKQVNDRYGHLAGDELLVEVGRRLGTAVRGDDLVARLGGDEFAVLLGERASRGEAHEVARRLHSSLIRPVKATGQHLVVGASVGAVVVSRAEPVDVDLAFHRADRAMYTAKRSGGGIRIWSPDVEEGVPSRTQGPA